jgi:hypothetical protein
MKIPGSAAVVRRAGRHAAGVYSAEEQAKKEAKETVLQPRGRKVTPGGSDWTK